MASTELRQDAEWRIAGPYFESCSCEAICPCRVVDGRPGSRATYRYCQFAVGWSVAEGHYGGVDLAGRRVVMVGYWDEDEADKPWRVGVFVDHDATTEQQMLLAKIVTGRRGGTPARQYGSAISEVLFVEPATVEIGHERGRQTIRVHGHVEARAREPYQTDATITCGVPGHDRAGYELVMETLKVDAETLHYSVDGRCGFAATFDYRSGV